eukprot:331366_1
MITKTIKKSNCLEDTNLITNFRKEFVLLNTNRERPSILVIFPLSINHLAAVDFRLRTCFHFLRPRRANVDGVNGIGEEVTETFPGDTNSKVSSGGMACHSGRY